MASVVQLKDAVELGRGLGLRGGAAGVGATRLRGGGGARGGDGWGAGAAAEKAKRLGSLLAAAGQRQLWSSRRLRRSSQAAWRLLRSCRGGRGGRGPAGGCGAGAVAGWPEAAGQ